MLVVNNVELAQSEDYSATIQYIEGLNSLMSTLQNRLSYMPLVARSFINKDKISKDIQVIDKSLWRLKECIKSLTLLSDRPSEGAHLHL